MWVETQDDPRSRSGEGLINIGVSKSKRREPNTWDGWIEGKRICICITD
jgi:hypothetical protein